MTDAADGAVADAASKDGQDKGDKGSGAGTGQDGQGKTFSQTDLDRIVQDRLARDRKDRPSDDDITSWRDKATKFDEIDAANKTELEKEREARLKAEADAKTAGEKAQARLIDAEILTAAAGKFADPSDAIALIKRSDVKTDKEGSPTNVGDLVAALLEAKPHLAAGGSRGGADQGAREHNGVKQVSRAELTTMTPEAIVQARKDGRMKAIARGEG